MKPSKGIAHSIYVVFNLLLPLLVLLLVRANFIPFALVVVLLSKWRMFAVRPRFWGANIRANAIDIIVGLSIVGFMTATDTGWAQVAYAVTWAAWLLIIKPRVSVFWVSLQALVGMGAGLMALFSVWPQAPLFVLVLAGGLICYFAAHHFFYSFDEPYTQLLSYIWAYFGAALIWILGHWLIYYRFMAQPTMLLITLAFGLGTMYYLDHFDKLSTLVRREITLILITIVLIVLAFSEWGGKIV